MRTVDSNFEQQGDHFPKALKGLIAVACISMVLFVLFGVVHVRAKKAKNERQQFSLLVDNKAKELGGVSSEKLEKLIEDEKDERGKRVLIAVMERRSKEAEQKRKEARREQTEVDPVIQCLPAIVVLFLVVMWLRSRRKKVVSEYGAVLEEEGEPTPCPETRESVAEEIRKLAELTAEGILSNDELTRAKELLLGKPKDSRDEMVRLLRNLNDLKREGVITQGEYNLKKWDILSKRNMS
jgi:hypothetical protein